MNKHRSKLVIWPTNVPSRNHAIGNQLCARPYHNLRTESQAHAAACAPGPQGLFLGEVHVAATSPTRPPYSLDRESVTYHPIPDMLQRLRLLVHKCTQHNGYAVRASLRVRGSSTPQNSNASGRNTDNVMTHESPGMPEGPMPLQSLRKRLLNQSPPQRCSAVRHRALTPQMHFSRTNGSEMPCHLAKDTRIVTLWKLWARFGSKSCFYFCNSLPELPAARKIMFFCQKNA